jgi:site-specific recombinase XerD
MQNLIVPDFLTRLRVGSVAPYIDLYLKRIEQQGFLPSSVPMQMYAIARFGKWLDRNNIGLRDLDESIVDRFLKRDRDVARSSEPAPLRRFMAMLREIGVAAAKRPEPKNQRQTRMSDYRHYLLKERGLAESTIPSYVAFADQFLADRFGDSDLNLIALGAGDVATFMRNRAHDLTRETAKLMVTGLRSFFRYLRHQGEITTDLAASVPAVANWSLSDVPKFLPAGAVEQVLDACQRGTPEGKRNYAVLLLLARLGLRACEIVALKLDDIDWDCGTISVRCKGGRCAQLPLPADVGEGVAAYLKTGRPQCRCRHLFLRHRAPVRGFAGSTTVSTIVRRALARAGVRSDRTGAHLFRHTLATGLLRGGASLDEIGEVLRHRSPNTTAVYAKVDLAALRTVALPWPGDVK